ncbi:MaoC family dehydratase [Geminicoccus roseus]|uniref:MaoC family dehydratase n=1 Tax=Geminicoccus roseus TaxID=404900 RepID=UPI0004245476|nr:MaoC/PaaZ C-terminal domain-containing protein [Geminicoccus roseus]
MGADSTTLAGRELTSGIYDFDQIEVGDHFHTSRITVTESHVVGFAGLSGDMFDVHMDDGFARAHGFAGRIAHGLLILSMADGLKNRAPVRIKGIASLGWNDWRFKKPVLINDTIRVTVTVAAKKPHRAPDRGIATLRFVVFNQHDEVVQEGETLLFCERASEARSA